MIAVAIGDAEFVGVDVEKISDKVLILQKKLGEIKPVNMSNIEHITREWTKKESSFKAGKKCEFYSRKVYDKIGEEYFLTLCTNDKFEKFEDKTLKSRLTAQSIKYDTLNRWVLQEYSIINFEDLRETITYGQKKDTILNMEPKDFLISKNDQEVLTLPQLKTYIERQRDRGVANIKSFEIELYKRYAMTAAAFILTIIGLTLSSKKVKGGMGVNIGIGLVLSFTYILFTTITSTFAISGYTSPMVAMWIPNIVYSIIAIYLYRKAAM